MEIGAEGGGRSMSPLRRRRAAAPAEEGAGQGTAHRTVTLALDPVHLPGDLVLPERPRGIVVFAHGSGSSRASPRNLAVAERLHVDGLGTLLFDLLTPEEGEDRERVFDVPLLASRLVAAARWIARWPAVARLPLAFFGASTGAAAAIVGAAELGAGVSAVVSRGGRPDLAGDALERVTAPTLLIVGGQDHHVLELNRAAVARMRTETSLEVVPGATHLFEEPGALEQVADLAARWISGHIELRPR
jgi:putative phosphoribosyl transferase